MQTKKDIHQQLDDFRAEYAQIQQGVRETTTNFLAMTVVYVHSLSPDELFLIFDHPFFCCRTYAPSKKKMLLHYFCCIMDARCDAVYKQASSYARALAHLYAKDELDEGAVREELDEHGGVEALRRHVQAVEANAKTGLQVLELESSEQQLETMFEMHAEEVTIKARALADGKGGWKRYTILSIEDSSF